jgi:hypothetical protein
MSLFSVAAEIETNEDFHLSRILLLLNAFAGTNREDAIEGITKLAKLDFLLRYPAYLERALETRDVNPNLANVKDFERESIESKMVRFKYGPWDFRYRGFVNVLVGKGLAHVHLHGRTIHLGITGKGQKIAEQLGQEAEFDDLRSRTKLLKTHFDLSASTLVKFIYETFPEIGTLRLGAPIEK